MCSRLFRSRGGNDFPPGPECRCALFRSRRGRAGGHDHRHPDVVPQGRWRRQSHDLNGAVILRRLGPHIQFPGGHQGTFHSGANLLERKVAGGRGVIRERREATVVGCAQLRHRQVLRRM
jgi:hypothetical protein